jgi:hypothetical protein
MRYLAEVDGVTEHFPIVTPSKQAKSKSLAARHARAMAAVLRAAKALHRTSQRFQAKHPALSIEAMGSFDTPEWRAQLAASRAMAEAIDRLVAVEKEVKRG